MFLEPRFKEMPFLNTAKKQQVRETVQQFELQTFIEQTEITEHETQCQGDPTTSESTQTGSELQVKKKKLELFFEDIMGSSNSEASRSVEEVTNAEINRYITESPEKMFCKSPLIWWKSRVSCYEYLSLHAQKVISVLWLLV